MKGISSIVSANRLAQPHIVDIYCRSAASGGTAIKWQYTACRQFTHDAGFTIGMVHTECGSGLQLSRNKLTLLRERCKSGAIQGVAIFTYDRLSRSAVDLMRLQEEMTQHGVVLYSVHDIVRYTMYHASERIQGGIHS